VLTPAPVNTTIFPAAAIIATASLIMVSKSMSLMSDLLTVGIWDDFYL